MKSKVFFITGSLENRFLDPRNLRALNSFGRFLKCAIHCSSNHTPVSTAFTFLSCPPAFAPRMKSSAGLQNAAL